MFKQMFAVVLSVLLMACHSVNNEPVQQEQPVITGQTRISLTGSFESLRTADGLRSLGFFMPDSYDYWGSEESSVSLSFGAEASHPAVLIVRNKQTKETHRKLVSLTKLGSEGLKFKIEGAFVFDNVATPFSEGDWSVMIVTAGRPDLVKEEVSGGTKTYKVWGEAFLDNCRSSEGDEVLTATSLPYASEWVDLTIQAGRSQAEAKADIVLRPFGTVFAVVINGVDKRYNGTVVNGWGASSNYIPRSGYFDLSNDALPEIGTLDFPRWVNHELLNAEGGTYSKEPLFNERVADNDPNWMYRRKPTFTENVYYKYWLFVFPVGEELPEVDDPELKLAVRYGDRLENRTPETWTKKHKVFWSSNGNSPLSELRGRIIESVNVTL